MASAPGEKKQEPARRLLLRPSSIVSIVFLALTAIALAYIAGVMSGRHCGFAKEEPESAPIAAMVENEGPQQEKILAPEELDFARALKEQTSRNRQPQLDISTEEPEVGEMTEADTASGGAEEKTAEEPRYDFLFQMAAFREESGADNLRERLEEAGYRTVLRKSGNVLVVFVRLRGTEARAEELRRFALSLKLGSPLLRERNLAAP